jgi:hypothetical protein
MSINIDVITKEQLRDAVVVLVRSDEPVSVLDPDTVANLVKQSENPDLLIVYLDDAEDITTLNEEEMAEYGWVRAHAS